MCVAYDDGSIAFLFRTILFARLCSNHIENPRCCKTCVRTYGVHSSKGLLRLRVLSFAYIVRSPQYQYCVRQVSKDGGVKKEEFRPFSVRICPCVPLRLLESSVYPVCGTLYSLLLPDT